MDSTETSLFKSDKIKSERTQRESNDENPQSNNIGLYTLGALVVNDLKFG